MAEIIEIGKDILKQVDIVDIVSHYVDVIKKGRQYMCVCPFHDDRNPSLMISKEKQIFRCFVCGTSGNAISFVMKYKKISYTEAIKEICDICNINEPRLTEFVRTKPVDESLQTLFRCTDELTKYYQYCLNIEEGKIASEYFANRGISKEQISKFQLGYSIQDGTKTINYLLAKGFSLKNIEDIGICLAHANGTSDNNHGRIIFPIHDANGRVVGYSARRLDDSKDEAKYVNSPETKLFKKSQVLYNLSNAIDAAKRSGHIYIVEGFMDALALDSIGESAVVALMGTAFTQEAAIILKRLRVEIRLCLDRDLPGQQAMMRAMAILDKNQIDYRIVSQDDQKFKDPDEILKGSGPEALRIYINSLCDSFNFATSYYLKTGNTGTNDDKRKIINHFMPTLLSVNDSFVLNDYVAKLSKVTGFEPEAIKSLIKETKNKPAEEYSTIDETVTEFLFAKENKAIRRLQLIERAIIQEMLSHKEAIDYYETNIDFFVDKLYRQIAEYIVEFQSNHNELDFDGLINEILASEMTNKDNMVNEIVELYDKNVAHDYKKDYMDECATALKKEIQKKHDKNNLEEELKDKTPQEKAKIMAEYIKNKHKTN